MKNFIFILAILLTDCATTTPDEPVKTLLTIHQSIINTRESISIPCRNKIIPHHDCKEIDKYYKQSKPIYDNAVDAVILGDMGEYNQRKEELRSLLANMSNILTKYNKLEPSK